MINPNLEYNEKQTCEQRKRNSKAYKKVKIEAYQVKKNIAKETGKSKLGFLGKSLHTHTQACIHKPVVCVHIH